MEVVGWLGGGCCHILYSFLKTSGAGTGTVVGGDGGDGDGCCCCGGSGDETLKLSVSWWLPPQGATQGCHGSRAETGTNHRQLPAEVRLVF